MRKPTVCLDLHAYHDLPQHHAIGYAHTIPILSLGRLAKRFASLSGPGLVMSKRNMDKKHIYFPSRPRGSTVGPSIGPTAAPRTPTIRDGKS